MYFEWNSFFPSFLSVPRMKFQLLLNMLKLNINLKMSWTVTKNYNQNSMIMMAISQYINSMYKISRTHKITLRGDTRKTNRSKPTAVPNFTSLHFNSFLPAHKDSSLLKKKNPLISSARRIFFIVLCCYLSVWSHWHSYGKSDHGRSDHMLSRDVITL